MSESAESDHISRGAIELYLEASGWRRVRSSSTATLYANGDGEDYLELILPNSPTRKNIGPVLRTLSQLNDASISQIEAAIRMVTFDVVRAKLPDILVQNDAIGLDVASGFIDAQRRLFASAATVELDPSPFFRRLRKEAQAYAEKCRFGHTFKGSFGFVFESPLPPIQQFNIDSIEATPPFERRVVERFARGLTALEIADDGDDVAPIVDSYESGFNANLCEDLASLFDAANGAEISISFAWSAKLKPPINLREEKSFVLSAKKVQILQHAARTMRINDAEAERGIYGLVIQLRAEGNPTDDLLGEREVVVRWLSEDRGPINVHVILPAHEYLLAVKAHHDGKAVGITGLLSKRGRYWMLEQPRGFTVLPM